MVIYYNVPTGGDSSADLESTGTTRYGIQLNGAGGALVGKTISTFKVSLKKTGTPTGNITATVRNSADTIRATFQETLSIGSVTTAFLPYTFTLASPITLANLDTILVEYAGTTKLTIELYTTDQFDGALTRRTRFAAAAYATSSTTDIVATITDGTFVSNEDTHKFKIYTRASNEDTHKFKVRTLASNQDTHKFKTRTLVSNTLTSSFKILPFIPLSHSFTATSFSSRSFTVFPVPVITTGGGGGGGGGGSTRSKRNKYRNYIQSLARGLKDFFRIKPHPIPPPPELVEIPPEQPPKTVTILSSPPTAQTVNKLVTLNDKWSVVASAVSSPAQERTEIVYPVILQPEQNPLFHTKIGEFPKVTKQPDIPTPTMAPGAHIESWVGGSPMPKNRSKTASTLNTLMLLLEMERQV